MNLNLKLMQTFLLVAEHNSFCRAAQESNRSQSAVSMQVRQLESQLGVSLFHRTTRHVELTREGKVLLESARKALAELETGLNQIKGRIDDRRDRLLFACAPTLATSRLPAILLAFQNCAPGIAAHVRELNSVEMLDAIRRQDVDFGIGSRTPNSAEFTFQPILRDPICALVPEGFDAGATDSVSLKELSRSPVLVLAGSSSLQNMLDKAQKTAGVTLDSKYDVQQVQTQIAMAAAGLGAAILPRIAIPSNLDPRLRALQIVDPAMACELCIITFRGQSLSPLAARFVDLLQRLIREQDDAASHAPKPANSRARRPQLALAPSPAA